MNRLLFFLLTTLFFWNCATPKPTTITRTKVVRDTVFLTKKRTLNDTTRVADLRKYQLSAEHFPALSQNSRSRFLILHYTSSDYETSVYLLTGQKSGHEVSSHYLVSDKQDDKIHVLVDENRRAWHAGVSHWRGRDNLNDSSIGIEIVNLGFTEVAGVQTYVGFPDYQMDKVAELAKDIIDRHEIDPTNVIGHSDVAPQRKFDPGPLFPWEELHKKHGIGAWPDEPVRNSYQLQFPEASMNESYFIKSVQNDLKKYGYEISETGIWDTQTKNVITKFQHHFRPRLYDGKLDAETWAILKALLQKYRS